MRILGRSRMEIGIAQPRELFPPLLEERARDHFAFHDVILELIDRHVARALVRIRVVADLEAGIEPLLDNRRASVALARHVQLTLVDEDRHRNLLDLKRSDEPVGDALEVPEVGHLIHDRTVVYGDGDAPRCRRLCVHAGQRKRERSDD